MDFPSVEAQLNDLPTTFTRPTAWYTQLIDSVSMGLCRFTLGEDATLAQVSAFDLAIDGWLDLWGLLWGVPRNDEEANSTYATRIQRTVLAWVGTLPAMQAWVNFYASGGTVTENPSGLGYVLNLPPSMTLSQIINFLRSFNRIRPAGVPFTLYQAAGGPYLGTTEHLGQGAMIGAYLSPGETGASLPIGAGTPNAAPLIPTLYLTDPTINPPGAPS